MDKNLADKFIDSISLDMVKPATQEEAEEGQVVVCGPDSYFPDDVRTFCADCLEPIVHRPHAPASAKKICMACAHKLFQTDDKPVVLATEQTLKEVKAFILRRKGAH